MVAADLVAVCSLCHKLGCGTNCCKLDCLGWSICSDSCSPPTESLKALPSHESGFCKLLVCQVLESLQTMPVLNSGSHHPKHFNSLTVPPEAFQLLTVPPKHFNSLTAPSEALKLLTVPPEALQLLAVPSEAFQSLTVPPEAFGGLCASLRRDFKNLEKHGLLSIDMGFYTKKH
eukprot:1151312-Pelagomonas_calceolata.AAC.3